MAFNEIEPQPFISSKILANPFCTRGFPYNRFRTTGNSYKSGPWPPVQPFPYHWLLLGIWTVVSRIAISVPLGNLRNLVRCFPYHRYRTNGDSPESSHGNYSVSSQLIRNDHYAYN